MCIYIYIYTYSGIAMKIFHEAWCIVLKRIRRSCEINARVRFVLVLFPVLVAGSSPCHPGWPVSGFALQCNVM